MVSIRTGTIRRSPARKDVGVTWTQSIGALSQTIDTLRGELEQERKARKEDRTEFERLLQIERTKREEMEKRFESERLRYQAYIRQLVNAMEMAKIPVPDWDGGNDV